VVKAGDIYSGDKVLIFLDRKHWAGLGFAHGAYFQGSGVGISSPRHAARAYDPYLSSKLIAIEGGNLDFMADELNRFGIEVWLGV
jgi:hypothetical protein